MRSIIILSTLLLTACATTPPAPPFPKRPEVKWWMCRLPRQEDMPCLSKADAIKLSDWIGRLEAYEDAMGKKK